MAKTPTRKKRASKKTAKKRVRRKAKTLPGTLTGAEVNGFPVMKVLARDLQGADYNPRTISDDHLGGLKASTSKFGLVQPIIWNKCTQRLVGGHQRLKILEPEEHTDVIVVDLPLEEEKVFNVVLNNFNIQGEFSSSITELLEGIQVELPDLSGAMNLDALLGDFKGPSYKTELVELASLKPHPKNYRKHPKEQVAQIAESIKLHGFYRNIAVAKDGTILAGHGVTEAARYLKLKKIPVKRLDLDPDEPRALKLVAGDNELGRLAEVDDEALANLLREVVGDDPEELFGTGFDDDSYKTLLLMTQHPDREFSAYEEWQGMPDYDHKDLQSFRRMIVHFKTQEDVDAFSELVGQKFTDKTKSIWFPPDEIGYTYNKAYVDEEELEEEEE